MIRVVHVIVAGEVGGAERMLVDLAQPSAEVRHAVALFSPSAALRTVFRDAGLSVYDRGRVRENPLSYLWRSFGPVDEFWLREVLRVEAPRIVHLHTFASQVLGTRAALAAGARIVRTEHSTRVFEDPSCIPFARWSMQRAHVSVAISRHVHRVAVRRFAFARDKMRIIANGVDTARFSPAPFAPASDTLKLVAVGRFDRRKGMDRAIEAVAQVPRAELTIVGDGDERARLTAMVRKKHLEARVRFAGYATDPRPFLAEADAFLCASREEGLGIALLEAMAMGRPVIAVPVGGIVEIVTPGQTGWLARADSVSALVDELRQVRRDDIVIRGAKARDAVVRSFSIEAMRAAYADVYREA